MDIETFIKDMQVRIKCTKHMEKTNSHLKSLVNVNQHTY